MYISEIKEDYLKQHLELFDFEGMKTLYQEEGFDTELKEVLKNLTREDRLIVAWENQQPQAFILSLAERDSDGESLYVNRVVLVGYRKLIALTYLNATNEYHYRLKLSEEEIIKLKEMDIFSKRFKLTKSYYEVTGDKKIMYIETKYRHLTTKARAAKAMLSFRAYESDNPIHIYSDMFQESLEGLNRMKNTVIKEYHHLNQQRFLMRGDGWKLLIQHTQHYYVDDEKKVDEINERWINKGYNESTKPENKNFNIYIPQSQRVKNKVKIVLTYYTEQILDHKYNDDSFPYYRHILKRHIVDYFIQDKTVSRVSLIGIDGNYIWKYDFNEQKGKYGDIIYKFSEQFFKRLIKSKEYYNEIDLWGCHILEKVLKKGSLSSNFEEYRLKLQDDVVYTCEIILPLKGIALKTSLEDAKVIFEERFKHNLEKYFNLKFINKSDEDEREKVEQIIHDTCLPYKNFIATEYSKFYTPSLLKRLLTTCSPKQINHMNLQLNNLIYFECIERKELRTLIYKRLGRKKDIIKEMNKLVSEYTTIEEKRLKTKDKRIAKKYEAKMNVKDLNDVYLFMRRMRKYKRLLTLNQVVETIGVEEFGEMVNGTYPCVFDEKDYSPSKTKMGQWIKDLLVGEKAVNNSKRLYAHLRKVTNVEQIIKGDFSAEKGKEILHTIKNFGVSIEDWGDALKLSAKVEPKGSPEFLMAGDASVCCMSFGAHKATQYAKEAGFGILNFYLGERVIANSVIWLNDTLDGTVLVIDNIEIHPNYKYLIKHLKSFYEEVTKDMKEIYNTPFVIQGNSYNDLKLYDKEQIRGMLVDKNAKGVEDKFFYTDTRTFSFVHGVENLKEDVREKAADKGNYELLLTTDGFVVKEQKVIQYNIPGAIYTIPEQMYGDELPF